MIKQFYVNNDKLKKYAENVAKSIDVHHTGKSSKTADNLREKLVLLYGNCKKLSQYGSEYAILPAELEWLLDNRYLAEREGKSALIDILRYY